MWEAQDRNSFLLPHSLIVLGAWLLQGVLTVLLLQVGQAALASPFLCPMENYIPEGQKLKFPNLINLIIIKMLPWERCWLQAGGFSKIWTRAEREGWGRRRDLQGTEDGAELRKEVGIWKKE